MVPQAILRCFLLVRVYKSFSFQRWQSYDSKMAKLWFKSHNESPFEHLRIDCQVSESDSLPVFAISEYCQR